MAFVIPTESFPDVRAAIGLADIDAVTLPDSVLMSDVYKGEAERFIMRQLTAVQYSNVDYADEALYAAVLYMASLVTPKLRVVQSERIAGGSISYANVNLEAIAERLEQQAKDRVADIQLALGSTSPLNHRNPNIFTVAKSRRSRRTLW